MATADEIRAVGQALPRSYEVLVHGKINRCVLSAMLAIWMLFLGLEFERRERLSPLATREN